MKQFSIKGFLMKKYVSVVLSLLSATSLQLFCQSTEQNQLLNKIETLNVTHGFKNHWSKRKKGVISLLKTSNANILALQEVIGDSGSDQFKAIKEALKDYDCVGKGRNSGIDGYSVGAIKQRATVTGIPFLSNYLKKWKAFDEHCPIFYKKDLFDLVETKTVGINGDYSGLLPRIYTMARLKEKSSGNVLDVYNTHLDHRCQETRLMQLQLIVNDIKAHSAGNPTILLGDLNTELTEDVRKVLNDGQLEPAREKALLVKGPKETHEKSSTKELSACDHIIIKPESSFIVKEYEVVPTMSKTTTDHNPVSMTFSLKQLIPTIQ
jgi:endonuclease/exonuclease/phosphatase family metal-dependent hydrolase